MKFYLGTHIPSWLEFFDVPLFVSRRRLTGVKKLPRALGAWALDSGGFSELSLFGEWRTTATQYIGEVRRFEKEIGRLDWAAPQDWMCEPEVLKKTGMTVGDHQRLTLGNFLWLRDNLGGSVIPVLQGWALDDYLRHLEMYELHGVTLSAERTVGVGSVCRRQHTDEAVAIFARLAAEGLRTHGFGVKTQGLARVRHQLVSADSMAWSLDARRADPLAGCSHKNCANCERYALRWRGRLLQHLRGVAVRLVPPPAAIDETATRRRRRCI